MDDNVTVIIAVATAVILLFLMLRTLIVGLKRRLLEDIQKKLMGRTPLRQTLGANFFGESSRGGVQIRGNGALVLTDSELFFIMLAPRKQYTIPLDQITEITLPRSHLGKSVIKRPLKVEYRTPKGTDSIAWALPDSEDWKDAIERAMKKSW